jgi:hypothetical protein
MTRPILALLFLLTIPAAALAQTQTPRPDQTTDEGSVVSVSRSTLVVKTASGDYKLFEFTPNTNKPKTLPLGTVVVVTAVPSEAGQMLATQVAVVTPAPAATPGAKAPEENIPPSVRRAESSIKRQTSKYRIGVRAGAALAPELVVFGVHGQLGPIFNRNFYARPNLEFAFGEVTDLFAINLDFIYRPPITNAQAKWAFYFGGGVAFKFIKQGFDDTDDDFSFDDFEYETGLNILAGIQQKSGMFLELRTTAYAVPTVTFLVGISF